MVAGIPKREKSGSFQELQTQAEGLELSQGQERKIKRYPRRKRVKAMTPQNIGKGLYRIVITCASRREQCALIPGVIVSGERVIFPLSLQKAVEQTRERSRAKRARADAVQLNLF